MASFIVLMFILFLTHIAKNTVALLICSFTIGWDIMCKNSFVLLRVAREVDPYKGLFNSALCTLHSSLYTPSQRCRHNGFDGVHAVFGFVEDDGLCRLENLVGDLHGIDAEFLVDFFTNGCF